MQPPTGKACGDHVSRLSGDQTVTQRLIGAAAAFGCRPALVARQLAEPYSFAGLASTICSTQQGILGYVKVASDSTSFEITKFTTSPNPSLFQLPPGATVTTGTTTPSS